VKHHAFENRNGTAAVELALLLPLLTFLLVIGIDFARVFHYSQIVENAARNGAIYASNPLAPAYSYYGGATATTDAQAVAALASAALADAGDLSPQPTVTSNPQYLYPLTAMTNYSNPLSETNYYPTDSAGNYYVQVTVSWTFGTLTGYVGVPSTVTLSRTVQMRVAPP
jgi:Flp pilus assembly protein TadG